jgi:hypothetical protein
MGFHEMAGGGIERLPQKRRIEEILKAVKNGVVCISKAK